MNTKSSDYLKFVLALLDAHNQAWSSEDIARQIMDLKLYSEFVRHGELIRVIEIVEEHLNVGLKLMNNPSHLTKDWQELSDQQRSGFYEAFKQRRPNLDDKCWAITFKLSVGSKARAYCRSKTRDGALEIARTKVLSGKLDRIEQVTSKSKGHNSDLIIDACLYGGPKVEVIA